MSYLGAIFYDRLMKNVEQACLIEWRRELLQQVEGRVLEIGAGTGSSLKLYPRKPNLELFLSEPDKNMRTKLLAKLDPSQNEKIIVLNSSAEIIDAEDNFFDWIFVSLVCCSVSDVTKALAEFKRVLKPRGKLIFLEHVAAEEGSSRRKWQERLNGFWGVIAGNCHLNRETEKEFIRAGFKIESIKRESMRKAISIVRPTIRGVATLS